LCSLVLVFDDVVAEIDKQVPLAPVLAEAAHAEFLRVEMRCIEENNILVRLRTTHLHATRSTATGKQSQKVLIVPFGRAPLQTNWCHDTKKVSSTILQLKTLRCPLHMLGSESSSIQAACRSRKRSGMSSTEKANAQSYQ
jgi:hypothetical protein